MFYLTTSLYFISFFLIAYTLVTVLWPERTALREQLGFYEKSWHAAHKTVEAQGSEDAAGFVASARSYLQRLLGGQGAAKYLKSGLEQAGAAMEWSEFILYHLIGMAVFGSLMYFLSGWVTALFAVVAGAAGPIVVLNIMAGKRRATFAALLPDTLTIIAGSLKAGYSLLQAVDMVSKETADPMADEFKRVLADARLGLAVEVSLDKMAARVGNTNFDWMVMAIKIQREVGGNLVEVLTTLAATIRERETVRRQIQVLTAEGRLSALILLCLPGFVAAALYLLNPEYIKLLVDNLAGAVMSVGAILLMLIGAVWLRKIVKIEV